MLGLKSHDSAPPILHPKRTSNKGKLRKMCPAIIDCRKSELRWWCVLNQHFGESIFSARTHGGDIRATYTQVLRFQYLQKEARSASQMSRWNLAVRQMLSKIARVFGYVWFWCLFEFVYNGKRFGSSSFWPLGGSGDRATGCPEGEAGAWCW